MSAGHALACIVLLEGAAVALFTAWSRRAGWGPAHVLAAATGAIVTYGGISLRRLLVAGGTSLGVPTTPVDILGQALLLLGMLGLSYVAWRHLTRGCPERAQPTGTGPDGAAPRS